MDRAIPVPGNEEIELYMRTYYSLLRSSGEVEVRALEETHSGMNASLHQGANSPELDLEAFLYCALRLPLRIDRVRLVLLGQSSEVFSRGGYGKIELWTITKARARRRKMFYDGKETLAVFINSISDIDDLIPLLTTFQIEWNKIHDRLVQAGLHDPERACTKADYQRALNLSDEQFRNLEDVWGGQVFDCLQMVGWHKKRFALRLLSGSFNDYRRATQGWWRSIADGVPVSNLRHRSVYFVSSNMHILPNLLSNYAALIEPEILDYLHQHNPEGLLDDYRRMQEDEEAGSKENLLNYVMRQYLRTPSGEKHYQLRLKHEIDLGIYNVRRPLNLDSGVQIIELARLKPEHLDRRFNIPGADWDKLAQSHAIIVNVDYPLGMAAYQVLSQVSASVGSL
ncbi:MAG: hypothetical protein R3264_20615, partial [Anaerolineae bacterium]|nr:hypothetical protein [Anaerolineae bacterium]